MEILFLVFCIVIPIIMLIIEWRTDTANANSCSTLLREKRISGGKKSGRIHSLGR
jgi:ABC-type transport system involved in cytochrome bd biosynthesis fused ATPase/permease subunit